jgi:hypothetical protein
VSAEQIRRIPDLEGAQDPGEIDGLLSYARQNRTTVYNLQRELGIGLQTNFDHILAERTAPVAVHIRPLVQAVLARAPLGPEASTGFATARGLEGTHLTDLLLERFQIASLFADDSSRKLSIQATTGRELPAALTYTFRTATSQSPEQFLYVMADAESGFINLRARRGVSLLEGEANVIGVSGMLQTLMADIELLPPAPTQDA